MLKLPHLSQGHFVVAQIRMANIPSANSNSNFAPTLSGAGVVAQAMQTLSGCSERCFEGRCIQCCPGSGCVTYPDTHHA